jgi:hypothetical protein
MVVARLTRGWFNLDSEARTVVAHGEADHRRGLSAATVSPWA